MPGVPKADAAQAPTAQDVAHRSGVVQESLAGPKREFIDSIHSDVVANIENARSFVARKTVNIFRPIGLAAAHRPIVDGVGEV